MYRVIAVALLAMTAGLFASLPVGSVGAASAAVKGSAATTSDDRADDERAPVTLDGEVLFQVRGMPAYPAAERALTIQKRLAAFAADRSVPIDAMKIYEMEDRTRIMAGDFLVVGFVDADATAEGVSRSILTERALAKIKTAIANYRVARNPRVLLINTLYALGATLVLALLLLAFRRVFGRLDALAERRLKFQIERLESRSYQLIQAQQLIKALHGLLRFLGVLLLLAVLYVYLNLVLSLYPWTRPLAARLFEIFFDPLNSLIGGFLDVLPNLVFIGILALITRYVLKLTRLYFAGVESGTITLTKFDRDWALPTYKIARLIIIAFAVVVAYPHIPGSDSEAFKGVSIFIGLMFSLGSSSVIGNLIAGYAMIYRRAFKVGDRVMIKDLIGDVTDIRLMVTHLRTVRNEEIVVPNSEILNSFIMNYSTLAHSQGLILHTTVGIGYETPWRQVEAMLRLAAERTPGLLKEPPPFILQKALGDFAVTYELNAYCDQPQRMGPLYTAMHQNILDVFNEHGVQIMTPAYEGDPEIPKVVAKDQWFLAPAKPTDPPADNGHTTAGGAAELGKSIPKVTA
jgi:small-conductance mechanosensitive channel